MDKKILAAIASISARSGYGHMGSVGAESVLAMLKGIDQGAFIRAVKSLADRGLIEIDEESGHLSLTPSGSSQVAADELPPPEPVRYEAKMPQTAPAASDAMQKVSAGIVGPDDVVTPLADGAPVFVPPADAGQAPEQAPPAVPKKQRSRAKANAPTKKRQKT